MGNKMRVSAGELSRKAVSDQTDYNMLELGYAVCETIPEAIRACIDNHKNIIDEDEWCVVRQKASDKLITTLIDYKYYAWPYLPSPRPDQNVFLYNRRKDDIVKRLWTLPSIDRMEQLATATSPVPKD